MGAPRHDVLPRLFDRFREQEHMTGSHLRFIDGNHHDNPGNLRDTVTVAGPHGNDRFSGVGEQPKHRSSVRVDPEDLPGVVHARVVREQRSVVSHGIHVHGTRGGSGNHIFRTGVKDHVAPELVRDIADRLVRDALAREGRRTSTTPMRINHEEPPNDDVFRKDENRFHRFPSTVGNLRYRLRNRVTNR